LKCSQRNYRNCGEQRCHVHLFHPDSTQPPRITRRVRRTLLYVVNGGIAIPGTSIMRNKIRNTHGAV
jgi:hypothetical protein